VTSTRGTRQLGQQFTEEPLGGHRVSARLDQNVEHVAVLVDRAPQVPLCAVDLDEHLIEVPFLARPPTTTAQLVRILLPEPVAPGPDRLIGHVDTTSEHQLLHIAEAIASGCTTSSQLMISGGNRNPVYDEPAAVTIVDPAPPHLPGSPT
jgi:hypothetical protein